MRTIAIANQKGGCGKTTTSINLAACLAYLQKKVLLIDLDPQGHSTCGLGIRAEKLPFSLYNLMHAREEARPKVSQVILEVNPCLSIIPSHVVLSAAEEELARVEGKDKILSSILKKAEAEGYEFDYVVVDCPPNLGVLTYNAFDAADDVVITVEPSFFSLHGLAKISETLEFLKERRARPVETHALLTIFNSSLKFAEDVYQEVKEHFKEQLFETIIHEDVQLKEAVSAGSSIVQYNRDSSGFRDYYNLAVEYLEREWDRKYPEEKIGWDYVVQNHFGPRQVMGGTLFQAVAKSARNVEVAGDFNNWIPQSMISRGHDELWQLVVPLQQGTYRYKFIVDGEWQIDPYHDSKRSNSFGNHDSFLEVKA